MDEEDELDYRHSKVHEVSLEDRSMRTNRQWFRQLIRLGLGMTNAVVTAAKITNVHAADSRSMTAGLGVMRDVVAVNEEVFTCAA